MIGYRFDKARYFFDKPEVLRLVDEETRRQLASGGARLRRSARKSMRPRKGPAPAGRPPNYHRKDARHPRGPLLRDRLYFALEPIRKSVVVGPEKLGRSNVPATMERGGTVRVRYLAPQAGRRKLKSVAAKSSFQRKVKAGSITKSKRQYIVRDVHVDARPYMAPTLDRELPAIRGAWADSVKS